MFMLLDVKEKYIVFSWNSGGTHTHTGVYGCYTPAMRITFKVWFLAAKYLEVTQVNFKDQGKYSVQCTAKTVTFINV